MAIYSKTYVREKVYVSADGDSIERVHLAVVDHEAVTTYCGLYWTGPESNASVWDNADELGINQCPHCISKRDRMLERAFA